jgi:YjbE family integral membrane protein
MDWLTENAIALFNVILIDVMLAGDNAIVVGLAASRVASEMRAKVIFWGVAAAVMLRVLFAAIANQLLGILGLTVVGGLLLLWVSWKMYRQITQDNGHSLEDVQTGLIGPATPEHQMSFGTAVWQIALADVSMSLDNVLAVAGVANSAQDSSLVLLVGLAVSVVLMAIASHYIAKLLVKYPWITWIGLLIIVGVAFDMIYTGSHKVTCEAFNIGCSETLWQGFLHRLGWGGT